VTGLTNSLRVKVEAKTNSYQASTKTPVAKQGGRGERRDHRGEHPQPAGAVHPRRALDLGRQLAEERGEKPDRKRQEQDRVGDYGSELGADETAPPELHEQVARIDNSAGSAIQYPEPVTFHVFTAGPQRPQSTPRTGSQP